MARAPVLNRAPLRKARLGRRLKAYVAAQGGVPGESSAYAPKFGWRLVSFILPELALPSRSSHYPASVGSNCIPSPRISALYQLLHAGEALGCKKL